MCDQCLSSGKHDKCVPHVLRQQKKKDTSHSLSLALTQTAALNPYPNHLAMSNFGQPRTLFRLTCSSRSRILKRGVGSWGMPTQENVGFLTFWDCFWCKLQKLEDLLLKRVVVFEARRIKGMTLLQAAEAEKQLVICKRHKEISTLILMVHCHP